MNDINYTNKDNVYVNTVILSDCNRISENISQSLNEICDRKNISGLKRDSVFQVAQFILHLWETKNKSIVDVPCGGGKSLWSMAVIHTMASRYLIDTSLYAPMYLVVDKLKTGKERLEDLLGLGLKKRDIGFYHSFWQEDCQELRNGEGYTFKEIMDNRCLCQDCSANRFCDFFNRQSELRKLVVILTHEGFIRLLESGRLPKDRHIVIDEEPSPYYMATFSREDIERLIARLQRTKGVDEKNSVLTVLLEINGFLANPENHLGTHRWDRTISRADKQAAYKALKNGAGNGGNRGAKEGANTGAVEGAIPGANEMEDWDIDILDENLATLHQMAYVLREGSSLFLYADNNRVSIARQRMSLDIPNRVLLLNGSASLYRYTLGADMQVYSCPDLKQQYPNLTLHCHQGLSTKKLFKNPKKLAGFLNYADTALENELQEPHFIAINKNAFEDKDGGVTLLMTSVEQRFPDIPDTGIGERGSIIGSNQWLECDCGIVAMSLFTDIAHYALHASLRHDIEIPAADLFHFRDGKTYLRVLRDSHLHRREVDDEFRREAAHELYQTIMRLRCRHDSGASVHVVIMIPYVELLADLVRLMPGIMARFEKGSGLDWLWEAMMIGQEIPNAQLYESLGINSTSGKNIQKARQIAAAFNYEPIKENGKKIVWRTNKE